MKRAEEENPSAEVFHPGEKKVSPSNSIVRNPAIVGKMTSMSMRQYSKKG